MPGSSCPQVPGGFENLGNAGLLLIPSSSGNQECINLMTHALIADHRDLSESHLLLICSPRMLGEVDINVSWSSEVT